MPNLWPVTFSFHILIHKLYINAECQQFASCKHDVHTIYHEHSIPCNMNRAATHMSVQHVTKANWLRPHDSSCAEVSKTGCLSYMLVTLTHFLVVCSLLLLHAVAVGFMLNGTPVCFSSTCDTDRIKQCPLLINR
jgi:hypothetical protein